MKLLAVLLGFLSVLTVGPTTGRSQSGSSTAQTGTSTGVAPYVLIPKFDGARLKGNKLIVTGENFTDGAAIFWGLAFCNEQQLNTRNDIDSPATTLISKKGGKYLPFDKYFALTVQNSNGQFSFCLEYLRKESFWALALPDALYPYAVHLQVGDYLIVRLLGIATHSFYDHNILARVSEFDPSGNDWAFQAIRPGRFNFYADVVTSTEVPPFVLYNDGIMVE
jgi:hypothetical protein